MFGSIISTIAAYIERRNDKPQPDVEHPISGVDVSHWQGRINWELVRDSGHLFAFIKATEGVGHVDRKLAYNVSGASQNLIATGLYHFATVPTPGDVVQDAHAEVEFFIRSAYDKHHKDLSLPAVLDIEKANGRKPADVERFTLAWVDHFQLLTGYLPTIYCGPNFWRWNLNQSIRLTRCPLWLVNYTTLPKPKQEIPGWQWTFWQHSRRGRVAGIGDGKVDVDLNRFRGTLNDLINLSQILEVEKVRRQNER